MTEVEASIKRHYAEILHETGSEKAEKKELKKMSK